MENNHAHGEFSEKNTFQENFDKASQAAAGIGSELGKGAQNLATAVKDFTADATRQVQDSETFKKVSGNAREAASRVDRQVRDNPLAAIGVAFGLGLLFASLVRRS